MMNHLLRVKPFGGIVGLAKGARSEMTNPMGAAGPPAPSAPPDWAKDRRRSKTGQAFGAIISRAASAGAHDSSITDSVSPALATFREDRSNRSLQKCGRLGFMQTQPGIDRRPSAPRQSDVYGGNDESSPTRICCASRRMRRRWRLVSGTSSEAADDRRRRW
jgi:hypothetical protein